MLAGLVAYIDSHQTLIAACVAVVAATIAYLTLKANHDWNRRQFALQMIGDWNAKTAAHRKAIEKIIPGLVDIDQKSSKVVEISKERALTIYTCDPSSEDDWALRFHLIELGNHLEYIATAYIQHVGDRAMLKQAFHGPLIRWHTVMHNFIAILAERRGYAPWAPFSELVSSWVSPPRPWFRRWLRGKTG